MYSATVYTHTLTHIHARTAPYIDSAKQATAITQHQPHTLALLHFSNRITKAKEWKWQHVQNYYRSLYEHAVYTWGSLDFLSQITHPLPFRDRISFPYHKNTSLLSMCRCERGAHTFLFLLVCRHQSRWVCFAFTSTLCARICFNLICWILHFSSSSLGALIILQFASRWLISHQYMDLFHHVCKCISIFKNEH